MSLSQQEIRLRIIEGLLPSASRLGINQPGIITTTANTLEKYVIEGYKLSSDSANKSKPKPRRSARKKDSVESEDNGAHVIPGLPPSY